MFGRFRRRPGQTGSERNSLLQEIAVVCPCRSGRMQRNTEQKRRKSETSEGKKEENSVQPHLRQTPLGAYQTLEFFVCVFCLRTARVPNNECRDIPDKNFMQVAFFCCFRQGGAGMSRDLGRDVPDLEKLMQENFGLIFHTLNTRSTVFFFRELFS